MSKLTYSKCGDYYIPELKLPDEPTQPLGKYGRLRKTYLAEHRTVLYNHLLLGGELYPHLNDIDEQAQHLLDTMIPQMMQPEGVTEALKATDQME